MASDMNSKVEQLTAQVQTLFNADKKIHSRLDAFEIDDEKDDRGRLVNRLLILCTIAFIAYAGYFKAPEYKFEYDYKSEISQIIQDEGLRLESYSDTLGNATIGFGHLIKQGENFGKITPHAAIELLQNDYAVARKSVESKYQWADGDVKLVLINMTFQMGPSRLAKFEKALMALEMGKYKIAAAELLDSRWASQAPKRAQRLAGRILQLDNSLF